ncbi:hypothetical protein EYF80_034109 [Liparis tanakae]|uniref:Uncharacterized protein n=1 Tax=Liparis tanakae TaxID=230148 RepID=A0A4Z2GST4_9TELE|nr:hypothetical protein EYF80_034109 [Liparis tanakae]
MAALTQVARVCRLRQLRRRSQSAVKSWRSDESSSGSHWASSSRGSTLLMPRSPTEVQTPGLHRGGRTVAVTLLFCSSRVRCSKQLLLRKMACSTGRSEHRNMSLMVSERRSQGPRGDHWEATTAAGSELSSLNTEAISTCRWSELEARRRCTTSRRTPSVSSALRSGASLSQSSPSSEEQLPREQSASTRINTSMVAGEMASRAFLWEKSQASVMKGGSGIGPETRNTRSNLQAYLVTGDYGSKQSTKRGWNWRGEERRGGGGGGGGRE